MTPPSRPGLILDEFGEDLGGDARAELRIPFRQARNIGEICRDFLASADLARTTRARDKSTSRLRLPGLIRLRLSWPGWRRSSRAR
jgi:hypothetical protein